MINLTAAIRIEKVTEKTSDRAADYRIFAGEAGTEIGGGWLRTSKPSSQQYISLSFADPRIGPRKAYANLAPVKAQEGRFLILWNPQG